MLAYLLFRLEAILHSIHLDGHLSHAVSVIRDRIFSLLLIRSIVSLPSILLGLSQIEETLEFSVPLIDLVDR